MSDIFKMKVIKIVKPRKVKEGLCAGGDGGGCGMKVKAEPKDKN